MLCINRFRVECLERRNAGVLFHHILLAVKSEARVFIGELCLSNVNYWQVLWRWLIGLGLFVWQIANCSVLSRQRQWFFLFNYTGVQREMLSKQANSGNTTFFICFLFVTCTCTKIYFHIKHLLQRLTLNLCTTYLLNWSNVARPRERNSTQFICGLDGAFLRLSNASLIRDINLSVILSLCLDKHIGRREQTS